MRRLHLTPDQIIGVASLPDVVIKRAPRNTVRGPVQGVYSVLSYGDPVDKLADDYLYVEVDRINGNWEKAAGNLTDVNMWTYSSTVKSVLLDAYKTIGETRPGWPATGSNSKCTTSSARCKVPCAQDTAKRPSVAI